MILPFPSRTRHARSRHRRRLTSEHLETRALLSTLGALPGATTGFDHDRGETGHVHADDTHTGTHYIGGVAYQFTWDDRPLAADTPPSAPSTASLAASRYPLTSIPTLHSNPGAKATLFIDFDGNYQATWGAYSNITTPVYDIDGDAMTFSDRELANINEVWSRAAEDYAPFNVDVTTVEPAVLAPGSPDSGANGKALRVAVGGTSDWMGASWGGYSYINSFTSSIPNVSYVFAGGNDSPFWIGDSVSHEAGHAFGLLHQSTYNADGTKNLEYNMGNATWAPIMGTTWTPKVTTWFNGTSSVGPTTYQDDMAVVAGTTNGFGYRTDDRGNTQAAATALTPSGSTWSGSGLIGTNTDVDVFSFQVTTADTYRVTVSVADVGPNLDSVVELRNAGGVLVGSGSPATSQGAMLVKGLTPGDYFVTVKNSGTYGWVGQYTVRIETPPAGITVTPGSRPMTTGEDGRTASFTVALDTQPLSNVVVAVTSSDAAEGSVSVAGLTFTPANWDVPQAVTVTGVADGVADSDAIYSAVLGAAVSTDTEYSGLDPADVSLVNVDTDTAGSIYRVDFKSGTIVRSRLSGSQPEALIDLKAVFGNAVNYSPRAISFDPVDGRIYWVDATTHDIYRAKLDGSRAEVAVASDAGNPYGFALDPVGRKLYWPAYGVGIRRANLDGTAIETVLALPSNDLRSLAVDPVGGKLYFTDTTDDVIRRMNLDGTTPEVLWASPAASLNGGLALDRTAGKMYWVDPGQHLVLRANLDGSNVETLVNLLPISGNSTGSTAYSFGIALDIPAGKMYWTDYAAKSVYRADFDGSKVALLATGVGAPDGLIVVPPSPDVRVSPRSGLVTSEAGGTASFTVALAAQPTAPVAFPVSTGDATEGTVSVSSLTFTPANWNVPQVVVVTGVDDTLYDQDVAYTIVLGLASSADPAYNGLDPADVSVTNRDNDPPPTRFYVVNDGSPDRTYEYTATGGAVENYGLNGGNTAPRGAASTAAGDKVWVVDANKTVYAYNTAGGLLGSWAAGSLASNAAVEGIATNGTDIWIVDAQQDKVFRYTGAASRLSGSQNAASSFVLNSGNTSPKDVVTDGTSLWIVNDSTTDKVFKYNLSGSLLGSWTITGAGSSPTGITLDPTGGGALWVVDNGTDRVYQFDNARSRTSGSQAPSTSFALAAGNTNPQGIADPPAPASVVSRTAGDTRLSRPPVGPATHRNTTVPSTWASRETGSPLAPAVAPALIAGRQGSPFLIALSPPSDQDLTLLATELIRTGTKRTRPSTRN